MNRINKHLKSYRYGLRGIYIAFRDENNMRFHLLAAIAVVSLNIILGIHKTDWLITLILVGLAWTAEVFNTALETLADRMTKEQDPLIAKAKDLASGAVLIISGFSVVCAFIIYLPYL
jgi:Diacylglycerol kinase